MKSFLSLLLSLFLFVSDVNAETIIIPVQDLLYEIPNFESPKYDLNAGLNGQYSVREIPKEKRSRKKIEEKIRNIVYDFYPDATSVRIWRGNVIVTLPNS
jgi:hypothetical protein